MPRLSKLSRSIAGKVALVTGAASGMGRATAMLFADEGAKVAVTDLDAERIAEVVEAVSEAGGEARGFVLDVSKLEEIDRVVAEVAETFGGLDILVNNAGIGRPTPTRAESFEADWEKTLAVNLTAHARTVRAALAHLQVGGEGRVVNIASTEGVGAQAYMVAYTASKHGVVGLTRALAVDLGDCGVTVNCVCPGPIETGMTAAIPEEVKRKFARRRVPLRRYGDPEEVAHGILNFCLPASSYMNGAVLMIDGGLSIQN